MSRMSVDASSEAKAQVEALLDRYINVTTNDSRQFRGRLACVDAQTNLILESAEEVSRGRIGLILVSARSYFVDDKVLGKDLKRAWIDESSPPVRDDIL